MPVLAVEVESHVDVANSLIERKGQFAPQLGLGHKRHLVAMTGQVVGLFYDDLIGSALDRKLRINIKNVHEQKGQSD